MCRDWLASEELSHLVGEGVAIVIEKVIALRTIVQTNKQINKQTKTNKSTNKQTKRNYSNLRYHSCSLGFALSGRVHYIYASKILVLT